MDSLEEALKKTRDIAGRIVRRLREQKSTISLKHPHTIYNVAQVASVSFEPVGSEELEEQFEKGPIDSLAKSLCEVELEQTYPRLGTIYSLCSVYYPNIR